MNDYGKLVFYAQSTSAVISGLIIMDLNLLLLVLCHNHHSNCPATCTV